MTNRIVHVIGGGTFAPVKAHLALCAPAFGKTAKQLAELSKTKFDKMDVSVHLTAMCDGGDPDLRTNADISALIDKIVDDPLSKVVFMNAALVDFDGHVNSPEERLSSANNYVMELAPAKKMVGKFRRTRKDLFVVAFKTTAGATEDEQYKAGLNLLKASSVNLVLANDVITRKNMIITPEEARYHVTTDREEALANLVDMAWHRSHLTFTQSKVVAGHPVPWSDERIPASLRAVVDHLIARGAYKVFRGATVGHFATKLTDKTFLTSMRKTNFNDLAKNGLVLVETDGPDTVLAYGAKPSVGGQSQRIIFRDHPGMDCVAHAHVPLKPSPRDDIPVRSQREVECGSHACGKNTSDGLKQFGNLKAVMLDNHGPNIIFSKDIDPQEVIDFIEANFDLEQKTGGLVA